MAGSKKSPGVIFDVGSADGPEGCRQGWQAAKKSPGAIFDVAFYIPATPQAWAPV